MSSVNLNDGFLLFDGKEYSVQPKLPGMAFTHITHSAAGSVNISHLMGLHGIDEDSIIVGPLPERVRNLSRKIAAGCRAYNHTHMNIEELNFDDLIPEVILDDYRRSRCQLTYDIADILSQRDEGHISFLQDRIIPLYSILRNIEEFGIYHKTKGIIKCRYNAIGTRTGRLTCSGPINPLAIPHGEPRRQVIPREADGKIIQFDFSAMDFRSALYSAGYNVSDYNDLYAYIAKTVGITLPRDKVKTFILSWMYGISPKNASKMLGISILDVQKYMRAFYHEFPLLQEQQERVGNLIENNGMFRNSYGRPIYIDDARKAYANLIQSESADICIDAYIAVYNLLKEYPYLKIVMLCHDAIIIESMKKFNVNNFEITKIKNVMENIIEGRKYPIKISIGNNYEELKEIQV